MAGHREVPTQKNLTSGSWEGSVHSKHVSAAPKCCYLSTSAALIRKMLSSADRQNHLGAFVQLDGCVETAEEVLQVPKRVGAGSWRS